MGSGTYGAGNTRLLLRRWQPGRDVAALRAAKSHQRLPRTWLGARGCTGTGVLSDQAEPGRRLPVRAAGGPLGPCRIRASVLLDRRGQRI